MLKRFVPLLALPLLALGCGSPADAPDAATDVALTAAYDAPVVVQVAPVFDEFGTGAGVAGTATLTRTKDALWVDIDATGVVAGHAYTLWFVVFDNPRGCGKDGCGLPDLGSPQARVTLVNAGGAVATGAAHSFLGYLDRHDIGDRQLLLGDRHGVDNTYKSELHVILRSHGAAEVDAANLAAQLSEVGAFCNLPSPPTPDGCSDDGVMIFGPGGPPGIS